jgi:hypothetical protein
MTQIPPFSHFKFRSRRTTSLLIDDFVGISPGYVNFDVKKHAIGTVILSSLQNTPVMAMVA